MKTDIEFSIQGTFVKCRYKVNGKDDMYFICKCTSEKLATALTDTLNALHETDKQELIESL